MPRTDFVLYHPRLGFLVDTCAGGTWTELRTDAMVHKTLQSAALALRAAIDDGMYPDVANTTTALPWITD